MLVFIYVLHTYLVFFQLLPHHFADNLRDMTLFSFRSLLDNTEEKVMAIIDDKAALRVLRNGSGGLSSSEDTENKLIFRGGENWLQYQRFYSQIFHCHFYLHWYPFDHQTCYIDIMPASDIRVIRF